MANLTEEQKNQIKDTKEKMIGKYNPYAKDENGQYHGKYEGGILNSYADNYADNIKKTAKDEGIGSAIGKVLLGVAYLFFGGK